ncbi:MAG: 2-C-methyl-D-erythritol 4-phosphate cytidylyltransferase [Eubacteriales bacterium]
MNILLLMMGGSGTRVGGDIPKQYVEINGKPIFFYILNKYIETRMIDKICIISNEKWIEYVKMTISSLHSVAPITVVAGGSTRSESVKNGLLEVSSYANDDDVILIHDATHPYVDVSVLPEMISAIECYGGATLGEFQYDTCYQMSDEHIIDKVLPRQFLVAGASPEGFQYKEISTIYFSSSKEELESMSSAGAIALNHNINMKVIETKVLNLKITHSEDLEILKVLLTDYFFKDDTRGRKS